MLVTTIAVHTLYDRLPLVGGLPKSVCDDCQRAPVEKGGASPSTAAVNPMDTGACRDSSRSTLRTGHLHAMVSDEHTSITALLAVSAWMELSHYVLTCHCFSPSAPRPVASCSTSPKKPVCQCRCK